MKPTIGDLVHFVQAKPAHYNFDEQFIQLVHLPAIITAVSGDTHVNLQVFTDGTNSEPEAGENLSPMSIKWVRSVALDASEAPQVRTWHWPEWE